MQLAARQRVEGSLDLLVGGCHGAVALGERTPALAPRPEGELDVASSPGLASAASISSGNSHSRDDAFAKALEGPHRQPRTPSRCRLSSAVARNPPRSGERRVAEQADETFRELGEPDLVVGDDAAAAVDAAARVREVYGVSGPESAAAWPRLPPRPVPGQRGHRPRTVDVLEEGVKVLWMQRPEGV